MSRAHAPTTAQELQAERRRRQTAAPAEPDHQSESPAAGGESGHAGGQLEHPQEAQPSARPGDGGAACLRGRAARARVLLRIHLGTFLPIHIYT